MSADPKNCTAVAVRVAEHGRVMLCIAENEVTKLAGTVLLLASNFSSGVATADDAWELARQADALGGKLLMMIAKYEGYLADVVWTEMAGQRPH